MTTSIRRLLIAGAVALTLPLSAHAFGGYHHGHHRGGPDRHLLRGLDLTEAQRTQIHELFKAQHESHRAKSADARELRAKLHTLALSDKYDAGEVAAIAEQSARANAELIKARADLMNKTYALLTPEQKTKLQERMSKRAQRMQERMKDKRG